MVDPGGQSPEDQVGADQAMPDSFARATHAHGKVQQRQGRGGRRVFIKHGLIAPYPREVVDVARFG